MTISVPRPLALAVSAALAATCIGVSGAALAVDQTVEFGAPTVTSQQGQRLKVVVPVRSAPDDRATAASFMVRETEVPQGYPAVATGGFTVMRPAKADYVVLQSGEIVNSPEVSLIVSVAGDPRSPYRMDLQVPPSSATNARMAKSPGHGAAGPAARRIKVGTAGADALTTRKLVGPKGEVGLPPK